MLLIEFLSIFSLTQFALSEETASCSSYNDILQSGPKIHGKVEKKGVLPLNLWWNVTQEQHMPIFMKGMQDLQVNLRLGAISQGNQIPKFPLQPPTIPCQIFINHKHKIIFVRNTKTAGNSISRMLKRGCFGELSEKTRKKLGSHCFDFPKTEDIPNAEMAEQIWREYTVITTVRNPYSRAASAYAYLLSRRTELGTKNKTGCQSPSFVHFSFAPFLIGLQTQKYACLHDDIFHDYTHVLQQYQCLINSEGELAVDHVISVENIVDDWGEFVKDYGSIENREAKKDRYYEILKKFPVAHANKVHAGEAYAEKIYKNCGQTCLFGLAQYYQKDFEGLGYEDCIFRQ